MKNNMDWIKRRGLALAVISLGAWISSCGSLDLDSLQIPTPETVTDIGEEEVESENDDLDDGSVGGEDSDSILSIQAQTDEPGILRLAEPTWVQIPEMILNVGEASASGRVVLKFVSRFSKVKKKNNGLKTIQTKVRTTRCVYRASQDGSEYLFHSCLPKKRPGKRIKVRSKIVLRVKPRADTPLTAVLAELPIIIKK